MHWRRSLVATCLAACAAFPAAHAQPGADARPNVVLVITDDMGWGDLGAYGATDIRTPNIDGLARDGILLTNFYANGTTCSPTRAALISGRYQQRLGFERPVPNPGRPGSDFGLAATGTSLPQLLRSNGYATALIGKWHLGYAEEQSPNAHGFDYFFGFRSGYHDFWTHTAGDGEPDLWENDRPIGQEGYTTDLITDRAIGFIEEHAREPFFVELAYNAPHWPYQQPTEPSVAADNARHILPNEQGANSRADYVAIMEYLDASIGQVLAALDRLQIANDTIVIFTNDNGGEWLSSNEPLTGRKWQVYEGGIRVPALVRWPGRIAAGRVSDQVGITMDLTASILAVTGTPVPAEAALEGMNLFPIWEGKAAQVERTLFWRSGLAERPQLAVRHGDWKLIVDGSHTFVFDLRTDLSERRDLTRHRPDIAQLLRPMLAAWEDDVDSAGDDAEAPAASGASASD